MAVSEVMAGNYHIELHTDPKMVNSISWNSLLETQMNPTPFMRHEFLLALHETGAACPTTGWHPRFIEIYLANELVAATVCYLKTHSMGEYVFDWTWADAYERHGLAYYPKLICAVPFTPVSGTRLMARNDAARKVLAFTIQGLSKAASSAHLLFPDESDLNTVSNQHWLQRNGIQFHWRNPSPAQYSSFSDFLSFLQKNKKKKIIQERKKIQQAGITFTILEGNQIDDQSWRFFYQCYVNTYKEKGSSPYLNLDFFLRLGTNLSQNCLLFIGKRGQESIAASLVIIDRTRHVAWGRYWGSVEPVDCLHFEACYYQPIAWCIENKIVRFEGGAQGQHKIARGLLPIMTTSAHLIHHLGFKAAIGEFLEDERIGISHQLSELTSHSPLSRNEENDHP